MKYSIFLIPLFICGCALDSYDSKPLTCEQRCDEIVVACASSTYGSKQETCEMKAQNCKMGCKRF